MTIGEAVALVARILLAAALAYAAVTKLRQWRELPAQVATVLGRPADPPDALSTAIARALPFVELAVALSLVVFVRSPIPGIVAALLILGFAILLIRAIPRHVPCPCFGAAAAAIPVAVPAVVRNGLLLALAVIATGAV